MVLIYLLITNSQKNLIFAFFGFWQILESANKTNKHTEGNNRTDRLLGTYEMNKQVGKLLEQPNKQIWCTRGGTPFLYNTRKLFLTIYILILNKIASIRLTIYLFWYLDTIFVYPGHLITISPTTTLLSANYWSLGEKHRKRNLKFSFLFQLRSKNQGSIFLFSVTSVFWTLFCPVKYMFCIWKIWQHWCNFQIEVSQMFLIPCCPLNSGKSIQYSLANILISLDRQSTCS